MTEHIHSLSNTNPMESHEPSNRLTILLSPLVIERRELGKLGEILRKVDLNFSPLWQPSEHGNYLRYGDDLLQ